jgi:alpha-pyrone synthase
MHDVWISHLGHAFPGPAISQSKAVMWLEARLHPDSDKARFHGFAKRSGVSYRHSVLDIDGSEGDAFFPRTGQATSTMTQRSHAFNDKALPLVLDAIAHACPDGLGDITHVIVTTCTGAVAPGLDIQIAKALALRPDVRRTMIAFMGCYAAIPALRTAWYTCLADASARVLVVNCELSTLHLNPGPTNEQLIAALLFADGATAAVVESGASPRGRGLRIVRDTCALVPDTEDQMMWLAGADGFKLHISPKIAASLASELVPLSRQLLGDDRHAADVRWMVHPGGPRILDAVEKRLTLPSGGLASSRDELAEGGNRSSATVIAILEREMRQEWRGPVALIAFGPGLTADALLLERCP